jgi:hypothetical protein|tara:strand:- start:222 stop:395 length:174 start_codon:yes stop_codon:yes gene_type:complete
MFCLQESLGDKMTLEELYWWRVQRLFTMYNSITDDLVYKAMWKRKLTELMQRKDVYE